jgi:eukaryotic-like serine/threonine-protein kinase
MNAAGPRVPGYVLEARLGSGGSGQVWRARVAATGEPVALKRIPIDDGPEQARAARAEAAMLATLDHPHLVRLHDVVPVPDALVLVLDLAAGGSLADLVAARGRVTAGEAVTAMSAVGAALAVAHAAGVVHGDVSPGNVLFTDIGLPLLADLGVARIAGEAVPVRSTPAFIDPVVAGGGLPGPQTDVFMAAATTLFALSGTPPWPGASPAEALARAQRAELDVAAVLAAPEVPGPIARVLRTAMDLDPRRRGTAAGFALELRHAAEPRAIELSAGRARPDRQPAAGPTGLQTTGSGRSATTEHTPRHAAPAPDQVPQSTADGGAPRAGDALALTHGVRARPVASRPRRGAARRLRAARLATGCTAALIVAALGLLVAIAARGWQAQRPASHRAQPGVASPAQRTETALVTLAHARELAFAERNPALLAQVYLPGPLLQADAALLARIVPSGCGLVGAHTTYRDIAVGGTEDHPVITTTATLSPSRLMCAGSQAASAPGVGPTGLRIELVHTAAGYRIAAQRAA